MTVDKLDVAATIKKVQQLPAEDAHVSSALHAAPEVLIVLLQLLAKRLSLNSRNSSKPPSTDSFNNSDKANNDDDNQKQDKKISPAVSRGGGG